MQKISLMFESSPWLVLLCLIAGLVYAAALYYKIKTPWGNLTNRALFALRFTLVFFLSLLLLGPLLRQLFNTYEQPAVVLAIDNSGSISEIESPEFLQDLSRQMTDLKNKLENRNFSVEVRLLSGEKGLSSIDTIPYSYPKTNLNEFLRNIENDYESRNLAEVVLVSDGIFNQGANPAYRPFRFRVNTLGIGDTTEKADLILNNLLYNRLAYQGNKFPIVAEIFCMGYAGETIEMELLHKGKVVESRQVVAGSNHQYLEEQFLVEANETGYQQYRVALKPKNGELSVNNNHKDAFVDVIEGREKVLIAAPAPHPDIKALRLAIEKNQNYEVKTWIAGIDQTPEDKFDVYILHQLPNLRNTHRELVDKIAREELPVWYILGNQTSIPQFNAQNSLVEIRLINARKDNVFSFLNPSFNAFNYAVTNDAKIRRYPPVSVPFADFALAPQAHIALYQKVGSIETEKPLWVLGEGKSKTAILLGSGVWQWRIAEYAQHENTESFDELVSKTIQYLSAKDDKRKFRTYPVKSEFYDNEPVILETEAYNDIYERIYGQTVELKVSDENGNTAGYSYVTSEANSQYKITNLSQGIYHFEASTIINGKKEVSAGVFAVKEMQIEDTRLTADHQLLRNLARENGGRFYHRNDLESLADDLTTLKAQSVIHTQEDYLSIINFQWLFFLLIVLFSVEWFLRKYHGSY